MFVSTTLILSFSFCLLGANAQKDMFYDGTHVLNDVALATVGHDFKASKDPTIGRSLEQPFTAICSLLDQHLEIKSYNNFTNSTAIKAADAVLDYIFNDTCNWIRSLTGMEGFECTYGNVDGLRALCAEHSIREISYILRTTLRGLQDTPYNPSISERRSWLSKTFNGKDATIIDQVLPAVKLSRRYVNCNRNGATLTC